jgi:hypothetical protein
MKKSKTYFDSPKTECLMDFFPQLRTIPNGWDLSEMLNAEKAKFNDPVEPNHSEELKANNEPTVNPFSKSME